VQKTRTSIAAAFFSLIVSIFIGILSWKENTNSIRPSISLQAYLFFSLLFDVVRTRTLWLGGYNQTISIFFVISLTLRVVVLLLESTVKTPYMSADDKRRGPEELCGFFGLSLFSWMNRLLIDGYRKILSLSDMYPLTPELSSTALAAEFKKNWENGMPCGDHYCLI
jgi:ATP-binding cassette, subfamily C (CFTR/MRP), member 1